MGRLVAFFQGSPGTPQRQTKAATCVLPSCGKAWWDSWMERRQRFVQECFVHESILQSSLRLLACCPGSFLGFRRSQQPAWHLWRQSKLEPFVVVSFLELSWPCPCSTLQPWGIGCWTVLLHVAAWKLCWVIVHRADWTWLFRERCDEKRARGANLWNVVESCW